MIREENLETFLKCILEVLNGSVRDELQTDHTKSVVDALVGVLGRMVAQAGEMRDVATQRLDTWADIEQEFRGLNGSDNQVLDQNSSSAVSALEKLDETTSRIQASLLDDKTYEQFVAALRSGDAKTKAWLSNASFALNDLLQKGEESFYRPKGRKGVHAVSDNLDELVTRLNAYLCQRYKELPDNPILKLDIIPGGHIKRTAIFLLKENSCLPTRLVYRQDMDMEYTGTTVTDEFHIIKRVFDLGLPVPEPILVEPDPNLMGDGGCFMIMTEIQDSQPSGTYFGEDRAIIGDNMGPEYGKELAEVFARLHSLTLDTDPGAGEAAKNLRNELVEGVKTTWRSQPKSSFSLAAELGLAWLEANPLGDDRPHCMRHGDSGVHNMMSRDGHLAALIDWELGAMGDPAADIAQLKVMVLDFIIPWEEFKSVYIANGGPPGACDDHAVAYYGVWTFIYHFSMATNLWDNFRKGVRDDAAAASVASHSVDRLALYEARCLANAIAMVD